MTPLDQDSLRELRSERQRIGYGWELTQADLDSLRDTWSSRVAPDKMDRSEDFAVTRADGATTGVSGPRWLFHLVGIAHRAIHVGLVTQTGQIVLQRRARTKADWPDAWDMAVAGHVPVRDDGNSLSYEEGARKEMREELGLAEGDVSTFLAEGRLVPVGAPHFTYEQDELRNPPFYNAEVVQDFAATLTAEGMANLNADWEELGGIYLCSPQNARDMLIRGPVAGGLRFSLPCFLDWLERGNSGLD